MQIEFVRRIQFCSYCKKKNHLITDCRKRNNSLKSFRNSDIQKGEVSHLNTFTHSTKATAKWRKAPEVAEVISRKSQKNYAAETRWRPNRPKIDHTYIRFKKARTSKPRTKKQCFVCKNSGHLKINCKQWKALTIQPTQTSKSKN